MVLEATDTRKRAQSHAAADAVPARLSFVLGLIEGFLSEVFMSELMTRIASPCLWSWYFAVSAAVSLSVGLAWWWRVETNRAEKFHGVIWNSLVQMLGFVLLSFQVFLLATIATSQDRGVQVIFGIIYFLVFFYTVFCISGRGIEILQGVSKKGIKRIAITWQGIQIDLESSENKS